ncbi:MAG: hypothetical protein ACFFDW_11945 [Candidatus Thorarchaeota archaeon]
MNLIVEKTNSEQYVFGRYSYEYLTYIYGRLSTKEIRPFELLRLNGTHTLAVFKTPVPVKEFLEEVLMELSDLEKVCSMKQILYLHLLENVITLQHPENDSNNTWKEKIEQLERIQHKDFI